jgi:anaerobic dimethyl sulfoxide reductase subunit A
VAFREELEQGLPFPTPSGKIELYSERLAQRDDPLVPPVPRYLDLPEGPRDPLRQRLPLQLLTPKHKQRINSTLDNVFGDEQSLTLHPGDAAARDLRQGQLVSVWNDRGQVNARLRTSDNVTPGVAILPSGAWLTWDDAGHGVRGCPNNLTSDMGTAWGQSSVQQTVLVEVSPAPGPA